jgi:hypothetical protein
MYVSVGRAIILTNEELKVINNHWIEGCGFSSLSGIEEGASSGCSQGDGSRRQQDAMLAQRELLLLLIS